MIENKSEITTVLAISKDECSESNDFLDFINNKKKDKKNGHGEDVSIKMISIYPELYREHMHTAGRNVLFVSRENQSHFHNVIHNDMILSSQKKHIFSMPTLLVKDNDLSPQSGITSKNPDNISLEYTATNNTEKLTYTAKDDYKESNTETTKTHLPYAQLKNDVLSHRKELVQQNMQPRRLQSSVAPVADNLSKNRIDVTTKTAAIQNKSLNLDYPFLRWSGEHSVKVAIPMEQSPLRHLTLLPSDPRSAEMLSRQAGQLSGFTTQLLNPRQDDEESERRDVKYNEEEEKE